ncbi:phosphatidylglycerophosphate phosphatase PTPMT2-like [Phragmites australis]|uniref:phosphatidylglycerophosphate phosphatase PTPMT2-like n=1 Tax=Phragmites australis TaxID=29695 RepID=UPI002D78389B|nr:phosphatidylglycerophosphate phosphatase PTPMT2-like [Phragmites australis]
MAVEVGGRRGAAARRKAKEAAVGAAARLLFYPTLLYNVVRSKVQAEFRWWDEVDQFILLGAVPFRRDVPRLLKLGVHGVITLNEPFETLVPSSLYKSHGIDHLVIPTRDYMFAPSLMDINQAVDFIHRNASCGRITYIHCKAGRGRSTTIVLCYLVKYKNMTPAAAFEYVRSKRARVLLTPSQWKVVQEFSKKNAELPAVTSDSATASPARNAVPLTEANLVGNDATEVITEDASLSCHKTTPSRPMIKMLSCLFPSH